MKPLIEVCVYVPWSRVIWNQWVASSAHPRKTRGCPFGTTPRPVSTITTRSSAELTVIYKLYSPHISRAMNRWAGTESRGTWTYTESTIDSAEPIIHALSHSSILPIRQFTCDCIGGLQAQHSSANVPAPLTFQILLPPSCHSKSNAHYGKSGATLTGTPIHSDRAV